VGGGPAGIAAAVSLLEHGHQVTIFDRETKLGGTPARLIPDERYEDADEEIDAILGPAVKAGRLTLRLGQALGRDVSLEDVRAGFDAVLLALGLGAPPVGGSQRPGGVMDALTFLRAVKDDVMPSMPEGVAVVGGGNTAIDAAVTAKEKGAIDVYLVYRRSFGEMPAWPAERDRFVAMGGHVLILSQPAGYVVDANGRLKGLTVVRTALGDADSSGRRAPTSVPGESVLDVGLVVEALGQEVPMEVRRALDGVAFTRDGTVFRKAPGDFATSIEGVFAAGDLVNGGTTVVQGVAEGMKAAEEMDLFMRKMK
jgi:NADPH-dependent glutamate synthase beta subunit-like oxidoreductase